MLKRLHYKVIAACAIAVLASACAHRVDVRPNEPVAPDLKQTLVVTNETAKPLQLLPALPGGTEAPLLLQPQKTTSLTFTVRLEENASAGHEREVVLVPEKSSHYVTQSAIDLLLKARFDGNPEREIRVRMGPCLFEPSHTTNTHELHLKKAPLSGVPALQLCP